MLSVAVQEAIARIALGGPWLHPLQSETSDGPPLDTLLHLDAPAGQACCDLFLFGVQQCFHAGPCLEHVHRAAQVQATHATREHL